MVSAFIKSCNKMKSDRRNSFLKAFLLLLILGFAGLSAASAQDIGKIAGTVTDSQTGETLIGANVVIQGTTHGASSGKNGRYNILQVESGTVTLEATYIGYHKKIIKGVEVNPGLTTNINIKLVPTTVEGAELVVTAEEKMVKKDVTNTQTLRTRTEMQKAPGITTTSDFFKMQGGVVEGGVAEQQVQLGNGTNMQVRDESVKNIHIRGGRGGEVLFLVDGMPVTHPIYGGRSVLDLNISDVKNMELLTGAFNAEYGRAQSGVVKINTRSGSQQFKGSVEYKNDTFHSLGHAYDRHFVNVDLSGPIFKSSKVLPGEMYYFLSSSANLTNGAHHFNRERPNYNIFDIINITGKASNKGSVNAKVNYNITPKARLIVSYNGSWQQGEGYQWNWKNYPNHTTSSNNSNERLALQFKRTINDKTFYRFGAQYLSVNSKRNLDGKTPLDFWNVSNPDSVYSRYQSPQIDPSNGFFDAQSFQTEWYDTYNSTYTINGDITSQVHPSHMVKTGFEAQYLNLNYLDITGAGVALSPYGRYKYENGNKVPAPPGPYKEFGSQRWVFYTKPAQGSFYIQDKFELNNLIINYGVRDDWFWLGNEVMQGDFKQVWHDATGLASDWSPIKNSISPRFGISFPISENTVLYFSYGHFNQLPSLQYYYRDPYSGSLTGNPHMDYVRTIKYEFGFTHSFNNNLALDIKSYNRNVAGQVGSTQLKAELGIPVNLWENKGYSRSRGIEAKLTKRYSNHLSGEMTYTLQWASGFSSSSFEGYIRSINDFPNPIREHPLNIDIRHQILLQASIASPKSNPIEPFGLRIPSDWNLTILSNFSSGQPYTPGTTDPVEHQRLINTSRGPYSFNTDLKLRKNFRVAGLKTTLYIEAFNVFDVNNINMGIAFNNWTGEPYRYGDTQGVTEQIYSWRDMYAMMNPQRFSVGRRVQFGLSVDF